MMQDFSLNNFLQKSRKIACADALWRETLAFYKSRGVEAVRYYRDDGKVISGQSHAPERSVTRGQKDGEPSASWQQDADPLPRIAALLSRPFIWSEMERRADLTSAERRYMADLSTDADLQGLAIPVFGPNLRNALVALRFEKDAAAIGPSLICELQCASQISHLVFCDLRAVKVVNGARLSPRELEILRWIARGKSNSVIADILGISRHTVDTIMRRVFEKLEVHDRTTAAIRGLRAGLLRHHGSQIS